MAFAESFPKLRLADLWTWEGTVDRGAYALVGLLGFALKHNLDRWLAWAVFHRPWGIFSYWVPLDHMINLLRLPADERLFLMTMVMFSLPFIYIGLVMTVKRLRSAALPLWLFVLFFAPFLNLLFFVVLAMVPAQELRTQESSGRAHSRADSTWLGRFIPGSAFGAATLAVGLMGFAGAALTWFCISVLGDYGWSLFVALPFCLGMVSAMLYGYHQPRTVLGSVIVALFSVALLGALLLAFAIEGLVCIAMAAPVGATLAVMGAVIGHAVHHGSLRHTPNPSMMLALIAAVPLLMGAEAATPEPPPLYQVVSVMEVDAPPQAVWQRVIGFAPLPEPTDWIFHIGIAYPIRAEMHGVGVGAERHCVFSTGSFIEPIEVWEAPRRLKFSVLSNPAPMQEWTPYGEMNTRHLTGFLVSKGGQFQLVALPGGRTLVEATTWYQHGLWPAPYWRLWSDFIIHRIHVRVLDHVKQQTEAGS